MFSQLRCVSEIAPSRISRRLSDGLFWLLQPSHKLKNELSEQWLTCGYLSFHKQLAGTVPSRDLEQQSKSIVAGHNEFALTGRDELYKKALNRTFDSRRAEMNQHIGLWLEFTTYLQHKVFDFFACHKSVVSQVKVCSGCFVIGYRIWPTSRENRKHPLYLIIIENKGKLVKRVALKSILI